MAFRVDLGRRPIVTFRFVGDTSDEDQYAFLDAYWALVRKHERFYLVFDATASDSPNARQRKIVASSIGNDRELQRRYVGGIAFVLSSALQRGAATAVFWISPPPWPYVIAATELEGLARLNEMIAADSRAQPAATRW